MSDPAVRFHDTWRGMAQPIEGLVVSVPVLVEAQVLRHLGAEAQHRLRELCPPIPPATPPRPGEPEPPRAIADLAEFLAEPLLLGLAPELFDRGEALPEDLAYYAPEGRQTIRPTLALRRPGWVQPAAGEGSSAPAFGERYLLLVWEIPAGLDLDRPEAATGPWEYAPALKFDRLLRHLRVPVGLLTNRRAVRLVYAPHGESTGALTFRIDNLAAPGGRPLLDAFVMLLSAFRLFGAAPEHQLPALLEASRRRQADVTEALAGQVFEALEILLSGFEEAAGRGGRMLFDEAAAAPGDHLYGGLLTVLLRLVFLLYAEERALLPVGEKLYAEHLSVLGLFDRLQEDRALHPDSMALRFGAWDRLLALFRAVHEGAACGTFRLPPRRGRLFDPEIYPFLEGWTAGAAPTAPEDRAALRTPAVDDGTVLRVLEKLVYLEGQRLSYRALDVEQIGSVYEALMGYHVERVYAPAVCLAGEQKKSRVWVTAADLLEQAPARRAGWLQKEMGLVKSRAEKVAQAASEAAAGAGRAGESPEDAALAALEAFRAKGTATAAAGRLVLQPGQERRRTSSHYTPRSLTEPIVERTLAPLLAALGPEPSSEQLLALRICDPAMGSGAFLVAACRHLAEHLVAAWTREGTLAEHAAEAGGDAIVAARRRVAQRCLYGVDKNLFAVDLAKLSLWLVTLARDLPFTFLDHALRHGDSLVGLTFEQIRGFHWQPERQETLCSRALDQALGEVIDLRRQIQELAEDPSPAAQRQKEWLLAEAEDAGRRARLLGDLAVGAFFAAGTARERGRELAQRLTRVNAWLEDDGPPPEELLELQDEIRERLPVFHWMLEFPEVFYADRPDPLDGGRRGGAAWMDAFVGNPPFLGGKRISTEHGDAYADWLDELHRAGKNGDLSAHFFRRAAGLLGDHGTIGLIATNTIAQGETRRAGLQPLLAQGLAIYEATRSFLWPGEAEVAASVVHLAKGKTPQSTGPAHLDGVEVEALNSRLRGKPERADPEVLQTNAGMSFQGSIVLGMGFVLTPEETNALVEKDPRNADRIFPYLGGEELNTNADQSFDRYVINFSSLPLEEAENWPDLLELLRRKVLPERRGKSREVAKWPWWQFWRERAELYLNLSGFGRCLVISRHTKHLCFAFQPVDQVFAESTAVFAIEHYAGLAALQSQTHEAWVRLLSSSLEERIRYSVSDCFETFPFPHPDPRAVIPELETAGERLYTARARFMLDTQQGLTITYNLLKDPACRDPRIIELRRLHEEMDRAVLAAYGWDIPVPPFEEPAGSRAREAFEDEVLDRLFLLNAERAAEEKKAAAPPPGRGGKPGAGRRPGRPRKGGGDGQLKLGGLDGEG